jgi:hypothetical protein
MVRKGCSQRYSQSPKTHTNIKYRNRPFIFRDVRVVFFKVKKPTQHPKAEYIKLKKRDAVRNRAEEAFLRHFALIQQFRDRSFGQFRHD